MTYFKLIFKNIRFKATIWIVALTAFSLSIPAVFNNLYSNKEELAGMRMTVDNPAMVALIGPLPDGDYTTPVMFAHQMLLIMAIIHSVFVILLARDISRKEEESGLLEYAMSTGISKKTVMISQYSLGLLINFLIFIILFIGLNLYNIEGLTTSGNFYYALSLALFGCLFYSLTLLFAQLFKNDDMVFGVTLGVTLGLYIYRAMTDVIDDKYSILSPYHWLSKMQLYTDNETASWLLCFLIIVPIVILTFSLFKNRDLNDSYLSFDKNKKDKRITSYRKLLYHNNKVLALSWSIALLLVGLSYGSIFGDIDKVIGQNEMLAEAFGQGDGTTMFIGLLFVISAVIACVPGLMVNSRLLTEEKTGRLEALNVGSLKNKISRGRTYLSHYVFALFLSLFTYLLTLLGMYVASRGVDISITEKDYLLAFLNYSVVIVLVIGLSSLLIGISKQAHIVVWVYLTYMFLANYLGQILQIDDVFLSLSPILYLAELPLESIDINIIIYLTIMAIIMMLMGMFLFKRRNLL